MPEAIATTWGQLEAGHRIVDANGKAWTIYDRRVKLPKIALLISDGQQSLWSVREHDDEVALLDASHDAAIDTVLQVVPGSVLRMMHLPRGPDKPTIRALYQAHLLHQHHVPTGPPSHNTLAGLMELHALEHGKANPTGVPHIHVSRP